MYKFDTGSPPIGKCKHKIFYFRNKFNGLQSFREAYGTIYNWQAWLAYSKILFKEERWRENVSW